MMITRAAFAVVLILSLLAEPAAAEPQPGKVFRQRADEVIQS